MHAGVSAMVTVRAEDGGRRAEEQTEALLRGVQAG